MLASWFTRYIISLAKEGLIGRVSMHLRWIDIDYTHRAHSVVEHTQLLDLLLQKPLDTMGHKRNERERKGIFD